MRAVVWRGKENVAVEEVDDPKIEEPTDAVIRVTSTAICGSDLHLYSKLWPVMREGDVLGHEPMGVVEAVGPEVPYLRQGDRVVVPFACGHCFLCGIGMQSQCETTQNRETRKGAALFGYTHLYGAIPGGQAEYLRVPQAHYGPVKVPEDVPDERYLFLSDVLPTAWQAVAYADVPPGGTCAVYGLGPIGQMCARVALRAFGAGRVIGVDPVPERRAMAERYGVETVDPKAVDDPTGAVAELTGGRGADSVIDARGPVRQAGDAADGPGERPPLGGRHRAAAHRRRPARGPRPGDAHGAARRGARGVPEVPAEGRRLREGGARAMNPYQERAKRPASAIAGPYGHPFHAALVPIPIGAWTALLVLDVASRVAGDGTGYARAATVVLGLGLVGAVLAALFGFVDYAQVKRGTRANKVATTHMIGNLVAVVLFGASFLARLGSTWDQVPIGLVWLTAIGLAIVGFTGFLGGKMAYTYGIRVADERTQAEAFDDISGVLPPEVSSAGRVDRIPGSNIPVDEARRR
jgi:threonine dehydrogenase-like Zn-dependent dehydrogenase